MNKSKFNSSEFWDNTLSKNYKLITRSPIYMHKLKIIMNEIKHHSGKILDVGIGYGFVEQSITKSRLDFKMYGLDISKFAVDNATKNFEGKFVIGDLKRIPFRDNFFDCVLALDILEHLSIENCLKSLNEIFRVLKFKGKFILSIPINENYIDSKKNNHLQKYDKNLIEFQLNQAGFKIIKCKTLTAFRNFYNLKTLLNNIFEFSNPNLLILICKKK